MMLRNGGRKDVDSGRYDGEDGIADKDDVGMIMVVVEMM